MDERYVITFTYDQWSDAPNIYKTNRVATIDYLRNVGVPFTEENLVDGGTYRMAPLPDGLVVKWEVDTEPPPEPTTGRGQADSDG